QRRRRGRGGRRWGRRRRGGGRCRVRRFGRRLGGRRPGPRRWRAGRRPDAAPRSGGAGARPGAWPGGAGSAPRFVPPPWDAHLSGETDAGVPDSHSRVRCMDTTSPSDISAFLDRYAEALAAGDLPGIPACSALPALVVGDATTIPVTEAAQVEAAFAGAADADRAQGLVGIRPELRAVDPLTAALTLGRRPRLPPGRARPPPPAHLLPLPAAPVGHRPPRHPDGGRHHPAALTGRAGQSRTAPSATGWEASWPGPNRRPWTRATP